MKEKNNFNKYIVSFAECFQLEREKKAKAETIFISSASTYNFLSPPFLLGNISTKPLKNTKQKIIQTNSKLLQNSSEIQPVKQKNRNIK